jgi:DSF synthase
VTKPNDAGITALAAMPFKFLSVGWSPRDAALTVRMKIHPIQCYSLGALAELRSMCDAIDAHPGVVEHFVFGSGVPGVFNFGGDLSLFVLFARSRDVEALRQYGKLCLDLVWWLEGCADRDIHTIALVEGDALGGGLESALPFHKIVADRDSSGGFPEVLFNLFPGMGAWQFVTRRAGLAVATEMILSGKLYPADEMLARGIYDVVAEPGRGAEAVDAVIRSVSPRRRGTLAALRMRRLVAPIDRAELDAVVDSWASAALRLLDRDLRLMEKLGRAQAKKVGGAADGAIEEIKRMEIEEARAAGLLARPLEPRALELALA